MDQPDFAEIKRILITVLDLPTESRAGFLDDNCPDPAVRREVEAKLAHAGSDRSARALDGVRDILAAGALDTVGHAGTEQPGSLIGPYRLVEEIGEGAIGVVWLAEQEEPIRRQVAVKIVKPGKETREVVARFAAERQALALMDHPGIARILDAGETPTGRAFFAMEHVAGRHITDYCDEHTLDTRQRLEVFCQVCDGVQHAHQKAIIHRDLKPSNVLVAEVDGKPVPKIIDFGIAKATAPSAAERTMFTAVGQLIGTPEYMSPEQADLFNDDVDTRTDVYSLGVLLFELLTGALPFDSAELRQGGLDGLCRMIREREPKRPSTRLSEMGERMAEISARRLSRPERLIQCIRGDLDWIVIRALEKDRNRRYGSPSELAADVRRHLSEEPVVARPPSVRYRMTKLLLRNRLLAGASAAGLLAVILFAVMMSVQAGRIAAERDRANKEAASSLRVAEFLADMLADTDPAQLGTTLQEDLRERVTAGQRDLGLDDDEVAGVMAGFERAMAPVNVTDAALRLIDSEVLARASAAIKTELADDPVIAARLRHTLGATYFELGLYGESVTQFEQAVETRKRVLGPHDPATLESVHRYGAALASSGQSMSVTPVMLEVLDARRRLLGDDDTGTLGTMLYVGLLLKIQTRFAEAEALYREAWAISRETRGEDDPLTIGARQGLGVMYSIQGRHIEGEEILSPLLAEVREKLGPEHRRTLAITMNLGIVLGDLGRYEEAVDLLRGSLEVRRREQGDHHPNTVVNMTNLANVLWAAGQVEEAESLLVAANEGSHRHLGDDSHATLFAVSSLALFERSRLPEPESLPMLRDVSGSFPRITGKSFFAAMRVQEELAGFYVDLGRDDEARQSYEDLMETRRQVAEQPDSGPAARSEYAWLLMTCRHADLRDLGAALGFATAACELTEYRDPVYLDTLAFSLAVNGQLERARELETTALSLLPAGDDRRREEMEARLAVFDQAVRDGRDTVSLDQAGQVAKSAYLYACHY